MSLPDSSREALARLQLFKDIRTFTDNDIPTINSDNQGALIRILAITNAQNTLTSATILFFKPSKMIKYHGLRPDISESSRHSNKVTGNQRGFLVSMLFNRESHITFKKVSLTDFSSLREKKEKNPRNVGYKLYNIMCLAAKYK